MSDLLFAVTLHVLSLLIPPHNPYMSAFVIGQSNLAPCPGAGAGGHNDPPPTYLGDALNLTERAQAPDSS